MKQRPFTLVIAGLLGFAHLSLGLAEEPILSLEECVQQALSRQPRLRQVQADLDIAKARIRQAWSAVLPHVELSAEHTYADISRGSSTTTSRWIAIAGHSTTASATVTQTLWDFGRSLARIKQGRADRDAARWQTLTTRQTTVLTATEAYLTTVEAQGAVRAAEQTREQAAQQLARTRGFAKQGLRNRADVLTAEAALSEAELALLQARNNELFAKQVLNEAMGGRDDTAYRVAEPAPLLAGEWEDTSLEDALAKAMAVRAELHRAAALETGAAAQVAAARAGWRPTIDLSGGYSGRKNEGTDRTDAWSAALEVNWDIWDGGLASGQTDEARARLRRVRAERQETTLAVTREVQEAWFRLREFRQQVEVAGRFVAEAEERLRLTQGRYAAGLSSTIDVTDANQTLAATRQAWLAARTEAHLAHTRFRYALGEEL